VGVNSYVNALAFDTTNNCLYAGGGFTTAGGSSANYVAKYTAGANPPTTGTWSALGSGVGNVVNAMALYPSTNDLYVGGFFTTAGGSAANYIAMWDTSESSWSTLGTGVNAYVSSIAVMNTDIYAGGNFTTAGGTTVNYVAKWNGSSWSAMGGDTVGTNGIVYAMAVNGSDLYAGGAFTQVKGLASGYFARYGWTTAANVGSSSVSAVSTSTGNLQIIFTNPSFLYHMSFDTGGSTWGSATTLATGTISSPALSVKSSNDTLSATWIQSNTVYGKNATVGESSTAWDGTAQALYTVGTNTSLNAMYEMNGLSTPLLWLSGTDVKTGMLTSMNLDTTYSYGALYEDGGTFDPGTSQQV
jgi:hypothetical protein